MSQLLFVHLAKTGGTSVRRILKSSAANSFDCLHHHTFIRFRDGERVQRGRLDPNRIGSYTLAFLMVRHPLARLISCYRYFRAGGLNAQARDSVFPADQAAQQLLIRQAPSIEDCCHKLPEIAARIAHFQPMAFWLDRLPNPLADRVFTGRQERFDSDMQLLFDQLGVPLNPAWLQRSNSSGPLQEASPEARLSAAALEQLQAFYAEDFRRFGYSLEPTGSER
tara:strand:+ start:619 stop:1287 length:669 start_codon:yes stop_codon:yes gene_type:complete